ncbi:PREDICTED: calcium-dependent secretion activator 2-like, partial [Cariama cristata]|uniref:calcium-dependent secretion activator 2-like n=1 Tax=Cariama cristata TaxID=54380 RepID=UPI0005206FCD
PDGIGTVSVEEKERFEEIKDRLSSLLENQISHFRYCFPFGRPEGALKATLSLLERVLMKDIATPIPAEEVKKVVRKCLEKAALINYTRLTEYAKIEATAEKDSETMNQATPARKLEEVLHLAELCIEVLQQNEEHHSEGREAFAWWPELLAEHAEKFLSLYSVDMDSALEAQPQDSWDSFPLFQLLNNALRNDTFLCNGKFHKHLQEIFVPMVVRYIDLMESSLAQSIHRGLEQESWQPVKSISNSLPNVALPKVPSLPLNLPQIPSFTTPTWMTSLYDSTNGSATSEDLFWKLDALQMFVFDLHWPEPEFAHHLEQRLKLMATDMIEACVKRTRIAFELKLQKTNKSTDLRIPSSLCTMFNVLVDAKKQTAKLCILDGGQEQQYHSKIDDLIEETVKEIISLLVSKVVSVLEGVLSKLSRYDEGTFFSSLVSFTVKAAAKYVDVPKPGMDLADTYIMFVRQNQDILREKVNEEMYIEKLFD